MIINKRTEGDKLIVSPVGRLDTNSSPELAKELESSLEGVNTLVFDLTLLEYISSAGLRVLLSSQKKFNRPGAMVVKNPSKLVMEIFEATGLDEVLCIE